MTIVNQIISFKLSGISYNGSSTELNSTAGVTPGVCKASGALVVDSLKNITGINTLSASTLTATTLNGTLATASQPSITSLGTLTNLQISNNLTLTQHNGSTIGLILGSTLVTATGNQLNYNNITAIGVAQASKTLVLDSSSNITGINNLSATTLSSTNLVLNGTIISVNGTQLNYNNITTPGVAQASRTLILNSSSDISGINTLSVTTLNASTLNGPLSAGPQTGITAVGTLTSLSLSGTITGATNVTLSGTLTGDIIKGRNLEGKLTSSDQDNITKVGTLSSLNVTNQITAGTVAATNISVGGNDITSTLTNLASISGVTAGTASASKALILDASRNITNINSLTSTTLVANVITGSLATASQPSITSLGTLINLAIAGSLTTVTNIGMTGSLTGANSISATSLNGRIDTSNQPNITSLGSLSGLLVDGNTGMGTTIPSRRLEINSNNGSCLRLSFGAPSGNATNFSDFTLDSSGALTINSSNNFINLRSNIVIGKSDSENILYFNGVTGDAAKHTVISERIYESLTEKSELLLFKGNDLSGTFGPDRIRLRAGEIRFQFINTSEEYDTKDDNNNALIMGSDGRIGINSNSNSNQQFTINSTTGNCLRLVNNNIDSASANINISSTGTIIFKASSSTSLQIGDTTNNTNNLLLVGTTANISPTGGLIRLVTSLVGNYIQSGFGNVSGSASDLIISDMLQTITESGRKIIFKADGKVGFGTSAPTRALEINDATGNCLRLSYNASAGSAANYCDYSISSTGVVTFTAVGSAPRFAFSGGTITGTLATGAQPGITSIGTLTSLALSGAITGVTNLTLSGTISGATGITATSLNGRVDTSNQPNITSVGTLTGLQVNGNINVGSSTSTDIDLLNIFSNTNAFTGLRIENRNNSASSSGTKISFNGFHASNLNYEVARIASITTDSGTSASFQFGSLAFYTRGSQFSCEERMRISSSGLISITNSTSSTSSTTGALQVTGGAYFGQNSLFNANVTTNGQLFISRSGQGFQHSDGIINLVSVVNNTLATSASFGTNTNHGLILQTNNTSRLTISNSGTITTNNRILMTINGYGYSHFSGTGVEINTITNGNTDGGLGTFSNHPFYLYSNNIERMRIATNGNIGIGTSSPSYLLDVNGTGKINRLLVGTSNETLSNKQISIMNSSLTAGNATFISLGKSPNITNNQGEIGFSYVGEQSSSNALTFGLFGGGERMRITAAGNVGIGTTSPLYPLHIAASNTNTISATYLIVKPNVVPYTISANATDISLFTSGRIYCNNEINVASDRRVKENIKLIDDNFCEKFIKLSKPVKYNYINQDDLQYGYIAQDLLGLHLGDGIVSLIENPDLLDTVDEESGIKNPKGIQFTIAYDKIVPILGNGLKIAYNKIDNLSNQIKEINEQKNKEINDLKQQMAEMQKTLELLLQKN